MAVPKSRQYRPGGGGGGGSGGLLAALLGVPITPELMGGETIPAAQGPELPIEAQVSRTTAPRVKQPGYFTNLLSRGQAGEQATQLGNSIKFNEFDNALKQQLLSQQILGNRDLETLRSSNDMDQLKAAKAAQEHLQTAKTIADQQKAIEDFKRLQQEILLRGSVGAGLGSDTSLLDTVQAPNTRAKLEGETFNQNVFNAADRTPDMMTARVQSRYADLNKPVLANQMEQQNILAAKKKLPTLGFLPLSEGNAQIDPLTGQVLSNVASKELDPAKDFRPGGVTSKVLPGYNPVGGFAKVPGGVNAEVSNMSFGGQAQSSEQIPLLERMLGKGGGGGVMNSAPSPVAQTKPLGSFQGPPIPQKPEPYGLNPFNDPNLQNFIQESIVPLIPQESQLGNYLRGGQFLPEGSQLSEYLKKRKLLQLQGPTSSGLPYSGY